MKTLIFFLGTLVSVSGFGQAFKLMGDAQDMKNNCILLTPDVAYSEGIAYHTTKLNLAHNFEISFDIYFGKKDEGADGITFVIQDDDRGFEAYGTYGECMGYGRWGKFYEGGNYIAPSIAIEFDTYFNERQNDPQHDHVAYLENGTNYHTTYWHHNDPNFNLEDDLLHDFRFRWQPDKQLITVFLDGYIVFQDKKDLINEIFGGKTQVIWGFTASTGRKFNLQYFCFKQIALKD
jgi:hypothetical protein